MKIVRLIIKIFNCVLIAISVTATIFLFASPSLSFNSRIDVNVEKFSEFIPKNDYSDKIDIPGSLGTDTISVSLKFKVRASDISKTMRNDKDRINEILINDNIESVVNELHEPVDLITEHAIISVVNSVIQNELYKQVDAAREKFAEAYPDSPIKFTTEEIMEQVGLTDKYFTNFTHTLYNTSNAEDASITNVNDVLFGQIYKILAKAKNQGLNVENSVLTEETRGVIKENVKKVYGQLNLLKDDGEHLEKISDIAYVYLSTFIKSELEKKGLVDPTKLQKRSDEDNFHYSDRLLGEFVRASMPDVFYVVVGYVSVGLFVGLFIFTLTWLFFAVVTAWRTFISNKTWTFFGPWFWLIGLLQLALGLVLTVACKFVLPTKFDVAKLNLPISKILIAPRTYALVPSILFLVCIILGIAYTVLKIIFKKKLRLEDEQNNAKEAQ